MLVWTNDLEFGYLHKLFILTQITNLIFIGKHPIGVDTFAICWDLTAMVYRVKIPIINVYAMGVFMYVSIYMFHMLSESQKPVNQSSGTF